MTKFEDITATAAIPDQLIHYVEAVSGMRPQICKRCLLYRLDSFGVLAAWEKGLPLMDATLEEEVEQALASPGLKHLTVLAATVPESAPSDVSVKRDGWWTLNLPMASHSPKLATLLRRAASDLKVEQGAGLSAWTEEHARLADDFCTARKAILDEGTVLIIKNLASYVASNENVLVFSARNEKGRLEATAIGDFTPFSTAFYMFAFRGQRAVPGAADLVLRELALEAERRGMSAVNLGLGINDGVEFFKKKWGASRVFPHVESSWHKPSRSFWKRLFGGKV